MKRTHSNCHIKLEYLNRESVLPEYLFSCQYMSLHCAQIQLTSLMSPQEQASLHNHLTTFSVSMSDVLHNVCSFSCSSFTPNYATGDILSIL